MSDTTRTFTTILASETLAIQEAMNIQLLSLSVLTGTLSITGNIPLFINGTKRDSAAISLPAGSTLAIPAKGPNAPLGGITLQSVGGNTAMVAQF